MDLSPNKKQDTQKEKEKENEKETQNKKQTQVQKQTKPKSNETSPKNQLRKERSHSLINEIPKHRRNSPTHSTDHFSSVETDDHTITQDALKNLHTNQISQPNNTKQQFNAQQPPITNSNSNIIQDTNDNENENQSQSIQNSRKKTKNITKKRSSRKRLNFPVFTNDNDNSDDESQDSSNDSTDKHDSQITTTSQPPPQKKLVSKVDESLQSKTQNSSFLKSDNTLSTLNENTVSTTHTEAKEQKNMKVQTKQELKQPTKKLFSKSRSSRVLGSFLLNNDSTQDNKESPAVNKASTQDISMKGKKQNAKTKFKKPATATKSLKKQNFGLDFSDDEDDYNYMKKTREITKNSDQWDKDLGFDDQTQTQTVDAETSQEHDNDDEFDF